MTRTALVIGGAGQIGQATCLELVAAGWRVTAAQKHAGSLPAEVARLGVTPVVLDRDAPGALAEVIGGGFDAVIDTVAYDRDHAAQLLAVEKAVGAFVVISSASVYCDDRGRTLDEAATHGFPRFPEPITEAQATVAPGPHTYSTRKVALEQALLEASSRPVTILRPGAIHGPASRHPREWFFVKRVLDGRRVVPVAWDGASRFHTSATVNIAALITCILERPATGILNIADPEAPDVMRIGTLIARHFRHDWRLVPFDGAPVDGVGASPWCVARPVVLDTSKALSLGYRPVARYEDGVGRVCGSAEAAARAGVAFPAYLATMFDYAAEDRFLAG